MTYEIYRYIFIGAAVLCGITLVVSVLLFILLKIPKVICDLSGATARKAIKNIREQNEASGTKAYKASPINEARGKLTDKISPSGNVIQQHKAQMLGVNTTKINTQELPVNDLSNPTTLLEANDSTTVLDNANIGETAILSEPASSGETTVLSEGSGDASFSIEYEITFIHTNEIIETEAIQ